MQGEISRCAVVISKHSITTHNSFTQKLICRFMHLFVSSFIQRLSAPAYIRRSLSSERFSYVWAPEKGYFGRSLFWHVYFWNFRVLTCILSIVTHFNDVLACLFPPFNLWTLSIPSLNDLSD